MTAPAENRVIEVNQYERRMLLNLLSMRWDDLDKGRMSADLDDKFAYEERQREVEELLRKLR